MRAKSLIISISMASMVFQPLAMAQQNKQQAQQSLKEFVRVYQPKGKPVTMKKFWDQNKKNFNPYWQKAFYPSVELQKNNKLPKMEVIDIKGPQGTSSERMILDIDGKTVSVEFLGGEEKFARINNIIISYADFYYVTGMLEKLSKDPVLAAENKKLENQILAKSATPSYEQYKNMTTAQKAEFLLMTRLAGEAATEALLISANAENQKTSFFMETFLPKAFASAVGLPCLVGGYEGKVVRQSGRTFCDPKSGIEAFKKDYPKLAAKVSCKGNNTFGCHPVNFPRSNDTCFNGSNRLEMQEMTSSCGSSSPYKSKQDQANLVMAYQKLLGQDTNVELVDGKVKDKETYDNIVVPYMNTFKAVNDAAYNNVCTTENIAKVKTVDKKIESACTALKDRKLDLELFVASVSPGAPPEVAPPPPMAGGDNCTTEKNEPGKKDKDGKCIPLVVSGPGTGCVDGVAVQKGDMSVGKGGSIDCPTPAATTRLPGTAGPAVRKKEDKGWFGGFFNTTAGMLVLGGGISLILAGLYNKWSKDGINVSPPIAAAPPAAPPLPTAPPQPTNPAPPAPIEGGVGTNNAPAGGQR